MSDRDGATRGDESESFGSGVLVKGRYLIERQLGQGGFGAVFLARDTSLHDKPVVVKVLRDLAADEEWSRRKFAAEVQALASINHPGVVQVLDQGESGNQPYLVMQFVEGTTMRSAIGPQGLSLARAARLLEQVGQALTAAHEQGICHRDLKPENIMLRDVRDGRDLAMLIDFGIAAVPNRYDTTARGTRLAGTFPYMAPEQMSGAPGHFSDIFAMGVIAYEMVTGKLPFVLLPHDPPMRLWFLQRDGAPTGPLESRADLPAAAREAILRALAFEPKDRYERACDFGSAFAAAIEGRTAHTAAQAAAHTSGAAAPSVSSHAGPASGTPETDSQSRAVEMAAVLFLDIVSYSLQPMDRQSELLSSLQAIVRGTTQFDRANKRSELISLPTGDGMALVFFNNTVAPVKCALEISRAIQTNPAIRLRMGMHSGPVYRHEDIKNELNVVGGGINMAQRVMDCGDAGHILASRPVADVLGQLTGWAEYLHDLGECQVKHGVSLHIYNIYKDGLGNPELPGKIARLREERQAPVREVPAPVPAAPPPVVRPPVIAPAPAPSSPLPSAAASMPAPPAIRAPGARRTGLLIASALVVLAVPGAYFAFRTRSPAPTQPPAPTNSQTRPQPEPQQQAQAQAPPQAIPAAHPVVPAPAVELHQVKTNPRDGQPYVWMPPGRFRMGCSEGERGCSPSEQPAHEVVLSKGFWIGQTEVTQEAYQAVARVNPSRVRGTRLPVDGVTWQDAQNYCGKAGMRLPTEAEWEYAAGAANPAAAGRPDAVGWYLQNSGGKSHEVRLKAVSAAGLYDMQGNVWEWVADWFGKAYYSRGIAEDPQGPLTGQHRVLRGGSWRSGGLYLRIYSRFDLPPESKDDVIGFRCAGAL